MRSVRTTLMMIGTAAALAGCMHNAQAAGDVAIDPATAANTTVLRVDNQHDSEMRVFAVMNGKEQYLGGVTARHTREFALDPSWLGAADVSFTSRQTDNSDALTRGPFHLDRGRVIDFVIPKGAIDESKRPIPVPDA